MTQKTSYTQEIADIICDRLAHGESLRSICEDETMPSKATVMKWLNDVSGFSDQYVRAREAQADHIFDELIDIADDGKNDFMEKELRDGRIIEVPNHEHITRSRLRFDARRWMLARMSPKKYGDKIHQMLTDAEGKPLSGNAMSDAQLAAALTAMAQNQPLPATEDQDHDCADLV